ncbi:hypothetical protein PROPEN_03961 [Proteus penneri ATCC 35198]|nr:hypothetical protein PROPEN_03961 [Proteus penneri ATCC 35198]
MVFTLIQVVAPAAKPVNWRARILKTYPLKSISAVSMNMPVVIGQSKMVFIHRTFLLITYLFHVTIVTILLVQKFAQVVQCINVKMVLLSLMKIFVSVVVIVTWHALMAHHNLMKLKVI